MFFSLKKKDKFSYIEEGEGQPIVLLHGLMGELSNFSSLTNYFAERGYKVYAPELPIYSLPVISTNIKNIAKHVAKFVEEIVKEPAILVGNSLGGHIGLMVACHHPEFVKALCLTGSSGLYEKSFGETYPKRGNYEYVERKTREVFYDPAIATKEIVDDVFNTVNDRNKAIKTLYIARDAIKSNMKGDLIDIKIPVCLIWGKQDSVTPPEVAIEFEQELPDATLYWIDKCGHAPMMEHPELFNEILFKWLVEKQFNATTKA
ncbi:Pimeloyl-ACP methyl ester carboxylesterase [Algoriella xinjiangensis]|uniref:Pimeloyl-ACP methyl ester carboxylesterase n=1 Tax=Algoriella xinjiangensis TaxID=684065 RepID=A0A1I4USW0_9FLAO|nr:MULTISPECIES: alpha/beta hydrolase [Algoriella]MBO6212579.1 alpha/beta hydrolase [Algoriella sp.]SFM91860.1 Pimeloyl-ACP methyl ester carboxylesterase [Algoriella xinjiangensis]VDH18201.1 2-hydroxy-6-oxo-6-phenylhexa-2,4-dienoate hydrolase [Algoriella xinjiangensis]